MDCWSAMPVENESTGSDDSESSTSFICKLQSTVNPSERLYISCKGGTKSQQWVKAFDYERKLVCKTPTSAITNNLTNVIDSKITLHNTLTLKETSNNRIGSFKQQSSVKKRRAMANSGARSLRILSPSTSTNNFFSNVSGKLNRKISQSESKDGIVFWFHFCNLFLYLAACWPLDYFSYILQQ